VMSES